MTQPESAIEQINLGYKSQEDRLLLRLGLADQSEVAVWISRRVCKVMWGLLQNLPGAPSTLTPQSAVSTMADLANKDLALTNFARDADKQKAIESMDFKSAYNADRQHRTEMPLLAVQCVMVSPDNEPAYLALLCLNNQTVKIALNNQLVHAIINMLVLTNREAGWDLAMTDDQTKTTQNLSQQVLH